jgi:Ser/Thr protein kinase RdoA (MazF antagonist)
VCHLDVCPENVFLTDGKLTVIDWENAAPAATLQDLGSTLWDFSQGDVGRTRSFVDNYRRQGGAIERLEPSVFDTARVVQANLIAFHCRCALDPESSAERRQRAESALRGLIARPLTARIIDDLAGHW